MAAIPPNHRRSLSVTAQLLEESMQELEDVLNSRATAGTTHRIVPSYSALERRTLLEGIARVRDATAQMFATLELEPKVTSEDQLVGSRLAHMCVILQDSLSDAMKGFGALSSEAAARIDAQVHPILAIASHLSALAAHSEQKHKK